MSILIVDDNEISLILIDKMLQASHYSTLWATSGAEALQLLEKHSDVQLVIADIVMPEMSGLELLRRIKESVVFEGIPVILCSAMADIENVRQGAKLGCHSYLVKPVQRELLLQKVAQATAAFKPVVASIRTMQSKYGLEKKACLDLIRAFLTVLRKDLQELERCQTQTDGSLPLLHLKQLSEGAAILGAEQLESRIEELQNSLETKTNVTMQLLRFTRDLKHLIGSLEAQIAAPPLRVGTPPDVP